MVHITVGSRVRTSPFYESTLTAGVSSFTIYNAMYMPTGYGDPGAEYRRLCDGVAMWDVAAERQVEVAGPDAFALANLLSARDLTGMKIGRARYAPMCDHDGRLINDPIALRVGQDRYWFSIADNQMLTWAKAIAREREYDVEVNEPDVSPLAIQGPLAVDLVRDLFGTELVDGLGFFHHCPVKLEGIPLILCRSGWSKQGGFELFLADGSQGNRLWELVTDAGAGYGLGPGAPNHLERIESGLLSFASDHDPDTDPIEAGLAAYTSLDGDHQFIGRAALEARLQRPIRRNIVNVRIDGDPVPCEQPWTASVDGNRVGQVRNAVWSDKLDAWIGLAQLATPYDAAGTRIDVALPCATTTAVVSFEPFGAIQT